MTSSDLDLDIDIDAARQFLAASGRVLDRRRFERLFAGGQAGPVRDAVAAYRNPDGGFGHALEPDGRCPGSQPLAIESALEALDEADAWDDTLVSGALGWLEANAPGEGGAVFVADTIDGWPHAPWLVPEEGGPASLITTGLLAGTLHSRGVRHPWLDRATRLMWDRMGQLEKAGPYDLRAVVHFLDHVPDTGRAATMIGQLAPLITSPDVVTLDPAAPGEIHTPLDFAPRPGSLARRPVRAGGDRGLPRSPGPRPARRRGLDVQLAGLVPGGRGRVARRDDRDRGGPAARQRPAGLTGPDRRRGLPGRSSRPRRVQVCRMSTARRMTLEIACQRIVVRPSSQSHSPEAVTISVSSEQQAGLGQAPPQRPGKRAALPQAAQRPADPGPPVPQVRAGEPGEDQPDDAVPGDRHRLQQHRDHGRRDQHQVHGPAPEGPPRPPRAR